MIGFPVADAKTILVSACTRGRHVSRAIDTGRVAFYGMENISTPNFSYAAQYLACALPCQRITPALTRSRASLPPPIFLPVDSNSRAARIANVTVNPYNEWWWVWFANPAKEISDPPHILSIT
jgi:hypothetical protein